VRNFFNFKANSGGDFFEQGEGTPRVGGSFGSAGCGGVALVQIMRRWQWRNRDDYSHVLVTPPTAEL